MGHPPSDRSVNYPFKLQRIISKTRGQDVKMGMEDATEDPKSSVKLTPICGLPWRIKYCHVIICKEGDERVPENVSPAMKTQNLSHIFVHCHVSNELR